MNTIYIEGMISNYEKKITRDNTFELLIDYEGKNYVKFGLSEIYTDKRKTEGYRYKNWNCVAFGKNAETICQNYRNRDIVSIRGRLTYSFFENTQYTTIRVELIHKVDKSALSTYRKHEIEHKMLKKSENYLNNDDPIDIDDSEGLEDYE